MESGELQPPKVSVKPHHSRPSLTGLAPPLSGTVP